MTASAYRFSINLMISFQTLVVAFSITECDESKTTRFSISVHNYYGIDNFTIIPEIRDQAFLARVGAQTTKEQLIFAMFLYMGGYVTTYTYV